MRKIFLPALLFLSVLTALSATCQRTAVTGQGSVVTQNRNNTGFTGIDLRIPADLEYQQSEGYEIKISAQQNILDIIETEIENGKLVIRFPKNTNVRHHDDIKIQISAPAVTALGLSGSGNIVVRGPYQPRNTRLSISGSGNITVDRLTTGDLDVSISGSGNIKVKEGSAGKASLSISGSGNMDLTDVSVKSASATSSGSGDMRVQVSDELDARISGSGNVLYKGRPVVDTRVSGSGTVRHL